MKMNVYAIVGLVLGIIGIFMGFYGIVPILGIIFSAVGLKQIEVTGEGGKELALAGLICSVIGLVLTFVGMVFCGAAFFLKAIF